MWMVLDTMSSEPLDSMSEEHGPYTLEAEHPKAYALTLACINLEPTFSTLYLPCNNLKSTVSHTLERPENLLLPAEPYLRSTPNPPETNPKPTSLFYPHVTPTHHQPEPTNLPCELVFAALAGGRPEAAYRRGARPPGYGVLLHSA